MNRETTEHIRHVVVRVVRMHNSHEHDACLCPGASCFLCVWAIDRGKQIVAIAREWGVAVRPVRVQVGNLISDDYRRLEIASRDT